MTTHDYFCTDCANYDSCLTPKKLPNVWFCNTGNFTPLSPEQRALREQEHEDAQSDLFAYRDLSSEEYAEVLRNRGLSQELLRST